MGTACVTPSPESSTTPVVRPVAYLRRTVAVHDYLIMYYYLPSLLHTKTRTAELSKPTKLTDLIPLALRQTRQEHSGSQKIFLLISHDSFLDLKALQSEEQDAKNHADQNS